MKQNLLISFSGGETSAFMAQWLWKNMQNEYNMIFVFANTSEENEETLSFVKKCSEYFGFPVIWVESKVHHNKRKSSTYNIVTYETASRDGSIFREMVSKYGIPNRTSPHCTRELKERPIKALGNAIFGRGQYFTAIGIREDEFDRMNEDKESKKYLYPLISKDFTPQTKKKINSFWAAMPFRLNLKGYEGNCKVCWKKHFHKLYQIAKESPVRFDTFKAIELEFGEFIPITRLKKLLKENKPYSLPIRLNQWKHNYRR